jgi:nicotinamidase-related amidase
MSTALLVIDMQAFFRPMTTTCLPTMRRLISHFQSQSLPIILTQHGHPPSDLKPPFTNQLVRKWGVEGSIATNTPDWELMHEITSVVPEPTALIPKNTYDAFQGTELENLLREERITRVVLCGVMTDCCVSTTGRSAFCKGFETWVVSDGTGSSGKRQHENALKEWGFGFGDVITGDAVIERLGHDQGE